VCDAFFEGLVSHARYVEDLVCDAEFPGVGFIMRTHDGNTILEATASGEKFAVKCYLSCPPSLEHGHQ